MSRDSRPIAAALPPGGDVVPCPVALRHDARRALAERLLRVADELGGCARAAREIGESDVIGRGLESLRPVFTWMAKDLRGER